MLEILVGPGFSSTLVLFKVPGPKPLAVPNSNPLKQHVLQKGQFGISVFVIWESKCLTTGRNVAETYWH